MESSIFNIRVPIEKTGEVFLMNTLTDAQLVVSSDVAGLIDRATGQATAQSSFTDDERDALDLLASNGFLVEGRAADREALDRYFDAVTSDTRELNITLLTTLQCNFACDYCFQGDHDDYNRHADKMSLETATRVAQWVEAELDRTRPEKLVVTFFGGEPLLNLPVLYALAERLWQASWARQVPIALSLITNGLLMTEEVVDRLLPYGLTSIKVTLDGDRDTHNRMRPLRGGQGTFDRIVENIRRVAGKCRIAVGGNFDESSVESFPALLDFLKSQEFADQLVKVNFKPIVRTPSQSARILPLVPVSANGKPLKPLNGTCMTAAGAGGSSICDTCNFVEDKMIFLREETKRFGFPTPDGVHMGPCHVHMKRAHTIGPEGSLYACPGFTGDNALSVGHIDGRDDAFRANARRSFDRLSPWDACGDCAFIPVCAGGCVVASHSTLGDMNTPTCHKRSFESAIVSMANELAMATESVE